MSLPVARLGLALTVAASLAGCAAGAGGDPGAQALPAGYSCGSVKSELAQMDSRGVPAKVQRMSSGGSLSAKDRADAQRYNQLLNYYLGGRCHV